MATIGAGIGLPAALVAGRVAQAQLYGVSGVDVLSLMIAVGVLGAVLLLATYFPARQASNVAPMEALRSE
jgi:ABC-type antimicrobial peptide transport system permease subunit